MKTVQLLIILYPVIVCVLQIGSLLFLPYRLPKLLLYSINSILHRT